MGDREELRLAIEPESPIPVDAQLVQQIRRAVAQGQLGPGDRLPTIRQLSVDLRVSSNLVARVYAQLEELGVLESRRGRGIFVRQRPKVAGELRTQRLSLFCEGFLQLCVREGFTAEEVEDALGQARKAMAQEARDARARGRIPR